MSILSLVHNSKLYLNRSSRTLAHCRYKSQTAHDPPRLENIGVFRAYGKPVATIFLWSALAYMSLQAVWSKLYFDEIKLETEARIDNLQNELKRIERS